MANVVYPGRWTRRRILDQALEKVGNVKILALAREQLNRLLEDLYVQYEWPFLTTVATLTVSGATADLPANFLKAEADDTALTLLSGPAGEDLGGLPIVQLSPVEWSRRSRGTVSGRPLIWYHDQLLNQARVWPTPDGAYAAQLVYKALPADMPTDPTPAYDADTPLFPYSSLLAVGMEQWGQEYEHNWSAASIASQKFLFMLGNVRNIAQVRNSQETTIPLDEDTFTTPWRDDESPA